MRNLLLSVVLVAASSISSAQVGQQPGVTTPGGAATSISAAAYPLRAPQGTVGVPSYSWVDDPDTGWYQEFADAGYMNFAVDGVLAYRIGGIANFVSFRNGSAGLPAFGFDFSGSSLFGLGMYATGHRILGFSAGGAEMLTIDKSSGNGTITLGGGSPPTEVRVGAGGTLNSITFGSTTSGFSFPGSDIIAFNPGSTLKATFGHAGFGHEFKIETIADNGVGASPAAATVTPEYNVVRLTCNDADGCNITMSEAIGSTWGTNHSRVVHIVNVGTNVCNFADTPGVTELAGAFAAGQYDALTLLQLYSGSPQSWFEISRSDN